MYDRLVITGMGAVTPLGIGVNEYWNNLIDGKSGIDFIESIDTTDLPVKIAGEVKDFDPLDFMSLRKSKEMDRFMQMTYAASSMAIEDSEVSIRPYDTGITVGTSLNGFNTITSTEKSYNESKFKRVNPRFLAKSLGNICAAHIAIEYGIQGASMTLNTACASGGDSIALAAILLKAGMADVMIAAGGESTINPIFIQSLAAAMALSTSNENPETACRPFDKDRNGFVMAEGAGAIIIEKEEHAVRRGAKIYGVLEGWGNNTDAYHPVTPRPDGEGEMRAMLQALKTAGLRPSEIGYVNAHGTATVKGDIVESDAIEKVVGSDVKVASTKAATGHMMGAGGVNEVISCLKTIDSGMIPPTLNLNCKSPECGVDAGNKPIKRDGTDHAMSNAFGFGGQNSSIIVGKYED